MRNRSLIIVPILALTLLFGGCNSEEPVAQFLLVPDTQSYLEGYPEVMERQFDWIAEQRDIDYVLHLGDVTQDNREVEWYVAQQQFSKLTMPYTITLGNHDMGSKPGVFADSRESTLANQYFPVSEADASFCYEPGKMDNRYHLLEAGGREWLIMTLAFGPNDKVLQWANEVAQEHAERKIILITHAYLYFDSTRMDNGDWWRPQAYGIGKDSTDTVNDGEQIWQKLVSQHPNFVAVFSGHVLKTGTGLLISEGVHGNQVVQILTNYQRGVDNSVRGGNGYLRRVRIDTEKKTMQVETWSTWEEMLHPDPQHHYTIDLKTGEVTN